MYFQHSAQIWRDFPALVPGVLFADGITGGGTTSGAADRFAAIAESRLAAVSAESELPEIQAWRRAFAQLGLKPTQYRCASESLLRRFRKEGSLPALHPLVDLCNAVSLAFAVPVAVLDVARITGPLEVRYATGDETYLTFTGDVEHPVPGEVIFADQAGQAHARRWTNRQSGLSAVRETTGAALIVAEALHGSAPADVPELVAALAAEIQAAWPVTPQTAVLTAASSRFTLDDTTPGASSQRRNAAERAASGERRDAAERAASGERRDAAERAASGERRDAAEPAASGERRDAAGPPQASAATRREPVRASTSCSACCVGRGWPARPR